MLTQGGSVNVDVVFHANVEAALTLTFTPSPPQPDKKQHGVGKSVQAHALRYLLIASMDADPSEITWHSKGRESKMQNPHPGDVGFGRAYRYASSRYVPVGVKPKDT